MVGVGGGTISGAVGGVAARAAGVAVAKRGGGRSGGAVKHVS